ncbi:MAG: hypothetical protein LQ343_002954 [Gyalolechia ehrenbergii]|nr:MAG: hypothetical protein LQ343_002954 [Gyalolechia ehrenbergii]
MRFQLYIFFFITGLIRLARTQENLQTSGNYLIRYCPSDRATQLQALLPVFRKHLQEVLTDLPLGIHSKAYQTFFKSQANIASVNRVFRRMADGDVILVPGKGPPFSRLHLPSILCLDPSIPNSEVLYAVCGEGVVAAIVPQRELVILCEPFWAQADQPSREQCPRVRRNYFIPNDHRVADNKFGVLVHQFARAYLSNWDPEQVFSPMNAARRSKELSLTDPNNYALYAATGCEEYVNPNAFHEADGSL